MWKPVSLFESNTFVCCVFYEWPIVIVRQWRTFYSGMKPSSPTAVRIVATGCRWDSLPWRLLPPSRPVAGGTHYPDDCFHHHGQLPEGLITLTTASTITTSCRRDSLLWRVLPPSRPIAGGTHYSDDCFLHHGQFINIARRASNRQGNERHNLRTINILTMAKVWQSLLFLFLLTYCTPKFLIKRAKKLRSWATTQPTRFPTGMWEQMLKARTMVQRKVKPRRWIIYTNYLTWLYVLFI